MSRNLTRVEAPAAPLVSLATAKAHLRVTHSAEDDLITLYASAAESRLDGAEGILGRALLTQTWRLDLDAFPADGDAIAIPLPPLQALVSIEYDDANGDTAELSAVTIRTSYGLAKIFLDAGTTWPAAVAVRVTFTAGYGDDASDVPAAIQAAALLALGALYDVRGTMGANVTFSTNPTEARLLAPYRVQEW